ncbi:MAG: PepSY-associated TM helix domain-containing protein [Gammaproteobacteria bacterium]|nr:PepSY-associated TM helix domain-containing protein [Gammaproteobacteria bacterium]
MRGFLQPATFVICWSGTFAVISHDLDWLVTPERRVQAQAEQVSWGNIEQAARRAVPGSDIDYMSAPLNRHAVAEVWLSHPDGVLAVVWVDPYTAEVTGSSHGFGLAEFFRGFHYRLFLPNLAGIPVGLYLVSVFALTMLASMVAALVFYKRWWRRFLKGPRGRGRAFWSELHKAVGLWSIWFLLVIGLTGGWYLYEGAQHDLFEGPLNYVDNAPIGVVSVPAPATAPALPALPLDEVIARAERAWPEFEITTAAYGWYSGGEDAVYLQGHTGGFSLLRGRANQMHLDPRSGEVLWQNGSGDLSPYWVWSNMADPLHFGNFAGLWSKAIWFVFGLLLSGLILTGTWLHAQRLAREAGGRARHRWPGTGAAIAVSLLVLAASVPFGFQEAREYYGPTVNGVKQLPTLAPGVKAVIIGWIALTLVIIASWILVLWRPGLLMRTMRRNENWLWRLS